MKTRFIWLLVVALGLVGCKGAGNSSDEPSALNAPPVPGTDLRSIELAEDTQLEFSLAGTDADGAPITFEIVDDVPETAGRLYMTADGQALFEAAHNFNGQTVFSFRVSDGSNFSDPVTVDISVLPVPDIKSVMFREDTVEQTWVEYPIEETSGTVLIPGLTPATSSAPFYFKTDATSDETLTYQVVSTSSDSVVLTGNSGGRFTASGTGITKLKLTATGTNGTSPPVTVGFDVAEPVWKVDGTFNYYLTLDATGDWNGWRRYRTTEPASSVSFNLKTVNADMADPTRYRVYTTTLENLNVPHPEDVRVDLYVGGELKAANLSPDAAITFDQYALNTSVSYGTSPVQLVIKTMADPQVLTFDLSFPFTYETSFRGTLCSHFKFWAPVTGTGLYLNALCSHEDATANNMSVDCSQVQCHLTNTATNEQAYCYQDPNDSHAYQCDLLDSAGDQTRNCRSYTDNRLGMCQPNSLFNYEPLPIPEPTTRIVVSVPDGGIYMGGSAIYEGSLSSAATRTILEGALTGSVSQQVVDGFLKNFQSFLNSDAGSDAEVASYVNTLAALNLTSGQALTRLLNDIQVESSAVEAAAVLAHLLPKWGVALAKESPDSLNGDERALIGLFMHQINERREQLVTTAEAKLQAYRENQKQCLGLSCVFTMAGFPAVIDETIQDVDTRWINALGAGVASGAVATAALSTVLVTVGMVSVHAIFPHAASIALTSVTGGLMALPVTVVVVAAVATAMAVDNLFVAQANEDAYYAFINQNSVRYTEQASFLGTDYSNDDRLMGEFVIAGQKILLEVVN